MQKEDNMNKTIVIVFLLSFCGLAKSASAAVSLPWSSSLNCAEWEYVTNGYTPPSGCSEMYVISSGSICGHYTWISLAGNRVGSAGRSIRTMVNAGSQQQTAGLGVEFTPQTSVWIRWYERYESGFTWTTLEYHKDVYIRDQLSVVHQYMIPEPYYDKYRVCGWNGATDNCLYSDASNGWSKIGDGNWHLYELHITQSGIVQMWIDQTKIIDGNLGFSFSYNWGSADFGSNTATPSSNCKAVDYDDLAISSTGYIGPAGGGGGDTTAPTISSVSATSITSSSATITWSTNEASDSQVEYSLTSSYGTSTTLNSNMVTSHSQSLSGLTAGTLYHYRVKSKDAANNLATSGDYTFTTSSASDTTPPVVTSVLSTSLTSNSAVITWSTNENSDSQIEYGLSTSYGSQSTLISSMVTSHSQSLTGLSANTLYHYRVKSRDAAGNLAISGDSTLTTTQSAPGANLFTESFDNSQWTAKGWYDGTEGTDVHGIIDTSTKYAGASSLRYDWSTGGTKPTNGDAVRHLFTATDTLYFSVYMRLGTGWVGSQQSYHPHLIMVLSDKDGTYDGPAWNYLNTYIEVNGNHPWFGLQDGKNINYNYGSVPQDLVSTTESRSVAGCNGCLGDCGGQNQECYLASGSTYWNGETWLMSGTSLSLNAWHHYEGYLKMNTISGGNAQANGIMQIWIDGTQVLDKSNIVYRTNQNANMKWRQLVLGPWIGDGSPKAQSMWLDELTLATARDGSGDTILPVVQLTSPTGGTVSGSIILSATASDNVGVTGVLFKVDSIDILDDTSSPYSITWNSTTVANGTHTISAIARDAAGNTNTAQATVTVANSPTTYHPADTDQSGCVSITELTAYITLWKQNSQQVSIKQLIDAIALWKAGCP
jgi:hypothetical protein